MNCRAYSILTAFLIVFCAPAFAHDVMEQKQSNVILSALEQARVSITKDEKYRYINSNGIPNHQTGQFPNRGNPNRISAQDHKYRVPLNPVKRTSSSSQRGLVGVALNGIPFEPGTAEFWQKDRSSGLNYEAIGGSKNLGLDQHNAHVQPNGTYHYHGIPSALVKSELSLVGYAADGFPFYVSQSNKYKPSYKLKSGTRPNGPGGKYDGTFTSDYIFVEGTGDLDKCNGTIINGQYVYILTTSFSYVPRCLYGTADSSFQKRRTGNRGSSSGREGRRPPPHHGHPPPRF